MTTGVAQVARCAEEMTGICRDSNRLLTPCHTKLQRPPRGPYNYLGVSTRGVRHSPSNSNSSIPRIRSATNRAPKHGDSKTPHLHPPCNSNWPWTGINSVQTSCIVKARLRKVHFSGDFLGAFDFLRIACSLGIPQEKPLNLI